MEKQGVYEQIPFNKVIINDKFWKERLKVHQDVTVDTCIKRCEETGRIDNFEAASKGASKGAFTGPFYNDSDVYKVLEGAAYSLMHVKNEELEKKVDSIIDHIAAAQEEDGYLMTYYTIDHPEEKWTDLDKHEMYCGGHLIEAAVAYYQSAGKRKFLDVACKLVDHYMDVFGPDKRIWVPGHEEIELALVRLYEVTQEDKYLNFSHWLLEQRGTGYGKGENDIKFNPSNDVLANDEYYQNNVPVRDIENVVGHAVRAIYLYTGMADVTKYKDTGYVKALHRVWDNIINKNMYITGGIGPSHHNEGFTEDYDLPNKSAYCETCAGIGLSLWNSRMAQLEGHGKYVDVLERAVYNNVLAGWSLSGDEFFYVNPLEADGSHNRQRWYSTACCPSNICRFIPSIGGYIYGVGDEGMVVNLFIDSVVSTEYDGKKIELIQETNYPVGNTIRLQPSFNGEEALTLKLRIPGWCKSVSLKVNGNVISGHIEKGYIIVSCKSDDIIDYTLDMPIQLVHAHENVQDNIGKVAVMRGPIVYALEQQDQEVDLNEIEMPTDSMIHVSSSLIAGFPMLDCISRQGDKIATFIPYFSWNNRGEDAMSVWIKEKSEEPLYY